jgi:hypothetical protein
MDGLIREVFAVMSHLARHEVRVRDLIVEATLRSVSGRGNAADQYD